MREIFSVFVILLSFNSIANCELENFSKDFHSIALREVTFQRWFSFKTKKTSNAYLLLDWNLNLPNPKQVKGGDCSEIKTKSYDLSGAERNLLKIEGCSDEIFKDGRLIYFQNNLYVPKFMKFDDKKLTPHEELKLIERWNTEGIFKKVYLDVELVDASSFDSKKMKLRIDRIKTLKFNDKSLTWYLLNFDIKFKMIVKPSWRQSEEEKISNPQVVEDKILEDTVPLIIVEYNEKSHYFGNGFYGECALYKMGYGESHNESFPSLVPNEIIYIEDLKKIVGLTYSRAWGPSYMLNLDDMSFFVESESDFD